MSSQRKLTGIVLSEFPLGENDKRLTILTKEKGKISVISKGCRKAKSHLHALSQAVTCGDFLISEGRNYNYLTSGECRDSFGYVKNDLDRILYSTYFAEVAEFYTVEDQDEREILNLLFLTFSAMKKELIPLSLIRRIFEFRILMAAGLGMQCFHCVRCGSEKNLAILSPWQGGMVCTSCLKKLQESIHADTYRMPAPEVLYALQYTAAAPLKEVYSFNLKDRTRKEYEEIVALYFKIQSDHRFRSESMIDDLY